MSEFKPQIFFVDDEPFCLWDSDRDDRNKKFLAGIDASYFEYLARANAEGLVGEDKHRAATALRAAYHQGLETLFLLMGAALQAPHCAYAWIPCCAPRTLRQIVGAISRGDARLRSALKLDALGVNVINWRSISSIVHKDAFADASVRERQIDAFERLWAVFAQSFCGNSERMEYNSIKHGLRIGKGGFGLSFGPTPEGGGQPTEMHSLGSSEFGSSFYSVEVAGADRNPKSNRSHRTRVHYVNWDVDSLVVALQVGSPGTELEFAL